MTSAKWMNVPLPKLNLNGWSYSAAYWTFLSVLSFHGQLCRNRVAFDSVNTGLLEGSTSCGRILHALRRCLRLWNLQGVWRSNRAVSLLDASENWLIAWRNTLCLGIPSRRIRSLHRAEVGKEKWGTGLRVELWCRTSWLGRRRTRILLFLYGMPSISPKFPVPICLPATLSSSSLSVVVAYCKPE